MEREVINYKDFVAEISDTNYDNDKEVLVHLYSSQKDYDEGKLKETVSLNLIDLESNIKEYIDEVYYGINQYNYNDRNYFNFVLGYDLLNDMIKKSEVRECDINYDFCNYIVDKFMETDEYKKANAPSYQLLENYINGNKDTIKSEYDKFLGLDKIRVAIIKPNELPKIMEINTDLATFQKLVGGNIQALDLDNDIVLICNEGGKILGLPKNRAVYDDIIVGNFVLVSNNGEDFKSLSDEQIKTIKEDFGKDSFIKESEIKFYDEKEVIQLLKSKERLVYVDDGLDEVIVRVDDVADFIVDYNMNIENKDLKIYDYHNPSMNPIATTCGFFLDKCDPEFRKKIIDRLAKVQMGEEPIKDYKIIDERTMEYAKELMQLMKNKNKEERDDR